MQLHAIWLTLMVSMMSLGPISSVLKVNLPFDVDMATEAEIMPSFFLSVDSIRCTHEEQVMPVIYNERKAEFYLTKH